MPYTIVVQELTFGKWKDEINPHPLQYGEDDEDVIEEIHDYFPRDACVPEGMHDGGYEGAYVGPYSNLDGLYEL